MRCLANWMLGPPSTVPGGVFRHSIAVGNLIGALVAPWIGGCRCDRVEEPHSRVASETQSRPVSSVSAAHTSTETPPPHPSSAQPQCVVPSPDEPPPAAEPAQRCPRDPLKTLPKLDKARVVFRDANGSPAIEVELAKSPTVRNRGLMYRTSMPEDAGMLFVWDSDEPRSFWMHNTCIPLDMLFIDREGYIAGILEQVPPMNDQSRRNPCPARQVLEVNAGYCRRHGIRAGQRIDVIEN